jgi:hypothetical protein
MGHSYVEFGDQSQHFQDIDIVIWVRCILAEWRRSQPAGLRPPHLDAMFAFWMTTDAFPGPGCVNLRLAEFLTDEEDRRQLLLMMTRIEQRIMAYGGTVPSPYLNEVNEPPGYDFVDQPSERVLGILRKFRRLLANEHGQQA